MIVDGATSTPRSCIISTEIPVADSIFAVPADTEQDDLNGKTPTLEHDPSYRPSPLAA